MIKREAISPFIFETLPPRNYDEWQSLGSKLVFLNENLALENLQGMIEQFDGPSWLVVGARLSGFRLAGNGFRFEIELLPGFNVESTDVNIDLSGLSPGKFLIEYDREFTTTLLTPPEIQITINPDLDQTTSNELPVIRVEVLNVGLSDLESHIFVLDAINGQTTSEITRQTITLLAGDTVEIVEPWWTPYPGNWIIRAYLESADGIEILSTQMPLVLSESQLHETNHLLITVNNDAFFLALALLLSFAMMVGVVYGFLNAKITSNSNRE